MPAPPSPSRGDEKGERWEKHSGPRRYPDGPDDEDIATGWTYTLMRGSNTRDVHVELAATAAMTTHLPEESQRAIQSEGWSAIVPYLGDDEPPTRIVISTAGVAPARIGPAQKVNDPLHG